MRTTRLLSTFAAIAVLAGLMAAPTLAAPSMQGGNLLQDPSFEQAASGNWKWQWWKHEITVNNSDNKKEIDLNNSFFSPSFMPSATKWDKESGGTSGVAGELSGVQGRKFQAGYYQTIAVAAGSRVRFSVYANGFCVDNIGNKCDVIVRAGIDPDGNDPGENGNFASSVQWTDSATHENWVALTAPEVTVGPSGKVTVLLWGEPKWPYLYNAAYFDEASLVVTAAAAAPTGAPPTAQPTSPPAPAAPAPCAQMRFVSDVTIPDNAQIAPGTQFVKTWRIKNTGTCAWAGTLNFVGTGNQMGGTSPTSFAQVPAGQEAELSISLTAPMQPGSYVSTWQVKTTNGVVLDNLFLKIVVAGEAAPPAAAVTATPQNQEPVPTATPTPMPGQICVLAFNDRNGDGQQSADENPLAGVVFALADSNGPKDSYTTDGVSEPYCFVDLQPGSYTLTAKAPGGYSGTSPKTQIVAISGGKEDFVFGARRGGAVATPTRASSGDGNGATSGLLGGAGRYILAGAALLVLIGLGFVAGFVLMSRR
jgi:hypothetical protein